MNQIEDIKCFGGQLGRYQHESSACHCTMTFSVFLPPQARQQSVPAVYWLSGLTCTDDNFRAKAGAFGHAAELGIAIVMPDTSPRGDDVADDADRYDLGQGAGFYVDASETPWSPHFNMYSYVTAELPSMVESGLPLSGVRSISGHSMGGHGALIAALKNPGMYRSVSAFAPIANPSVCPWGQGCFGAYLGADENEWKAYDATCLIDAGADPGPLLIDQGAADQFLSEQLLPQNLTKACERRSIDLTLRMQDGYDHSYYFIASFIGEHLAHHARHLR